MANNLVKYSFTGGELSPKLFGRTDLEQYEFGMAKAKNWIVDYRGGLTTRPGTEVMEYVMDDDKPTKFFDFTFAFDDSNTYLIVFGHNYIRFLQDGSYILETAEVITGVSVAGLITCVGHGYSVGDWIKINEVGGVSNINGRTYRVATTPTADTFTVQIVPALTAFTPTGTYTSGGVAERIYTVTSTYDADDLEGLSAYQIRDTLRLTHLDYPIRDLTRNDNTDWVLADTDIGTVDRGPTGLSHAGSTIDGTPNSGALYMVTALLEDGTETPPSAPYRATGCDNLPVTAKSWVRLRWNPQADAVAYRVYRSVFYRNDVDIDKGLEVGYVGQVTGAQFMDNNVVPDFASKPPMYNHPFIPGAIESIFVTADGSGYSFSSTMTITDPDGSGAAITPIVNSDNKVVGAKIRRGGSGYSGPSFSVSGGTGATFEATVRPLTGTYPAVSTIFQQRQIYAATRNDPLTLWGSKPRAFDNFDFSEIIIESDSFSYDIDSKEVSPIRHLIPMRGGMLVMSQSGLWQLTGGQGLAVTATQAAADLQTYMGCSKVPPLAVGADLLYVEGRSYTVRLLTYNDYSKVYTGEDRSVLSNHLFNPRFPITSWAFAENPMKIVWAVRSDGRALCFTVVKEEKVYSWTPQETRGYFKDVRVIREDNVDKTYFMVQRKINGRWTKFIERLARKDYVLVEDAICSDSALVLGANTPAATLTAGAASGNDVTFTASASVFSSGDVGKYLRIGGGKALVTSFVSGTQVVGDLLRPIDDLVPETDDTPNVAEAGDWSLDAAVTSVSGLWHLEGETVHVLGDGNVLPQRVVTNGAITLAHPCTRVVVGLPFTSVAQTLPMAANDTILEGKRKRVMAVSARLFESRGLKTGNSLSKLYDVKEYQVGYGTEAIPYQTGSTMVYIDPVWDENGQTYFVADAPLPVTLLAIVPELELGDDND